MTSRRLQVAVLAATTALVALPAAAQAPAGPGAQAARPQATLQCVACHGPLGISSAPDAPHIAGQPAIYLSAQLKAFRSGARKHEVMGVVAKSLSDADIDALANWYSALRVEVKQP